MEPTAQVHHHSLVRILKLVCAGGGSDPITTTKKGLLDFLERVNPKGPSSRPDQNATARAAYARKLARTLKGHPELKVGTVQGDLHNEVYKIDVVKHVLEDFLRVFSPSSWLTLLTSIEQCAAEGNLRKNPSVVGESSSTNQSPTQVLVEDLELEGLHDAPAQLYPSLPDSEGVSVVSQQDSLPVPGAQQIPFGPMKMNANKRRKLEETAGFLQYQQVYGGHTWSDLLLELMNRDQALEGQHTENKKQRDTIEKLQKKQRLLLQSQRRIGKAVTVWKAKAKGKALPGKACPNSGDAVSIEDKLSIKRTGAAGEGRYLTVPSRVSLSIRRNLSNIACADLGLVLLDDASRWTIARAEVRTGAALLASGRAFHRSMMEEIAQEPSDGALSLHIHFITQDATNSLKRKLTALILHSAWCQLPSDMDVDYSFDWKRFQTFHGVADVQTVSDSSAVATVGLTDKMLESLACPSIKTLVNMGMDDSAQKPFGRYAHRFPLPFLFDGFARNNPRRISSDFVY